MPALTVSSDILEVLITVVDGNAHVTTELVEILVNTPTKNPISITGAGVSQELIEVLASFDSLTAKISSEFLEVLVQPTSTAISAGGILSSTRGWINIF